MELSDALIVTGLGITVVFIGLILTSLMIYSFSFIHKVPMLFKKKEPAKAVETKPAPATVETDPEIIAAITAVLEVEFRKLSLLEGKYTFK